MVLSFLMLCQNLPMFSKDEKNLEYTHNPIFYKNSKVE